MSHLIEASPAKNQEGGVSYEENKKFIPFSREYFNKLSEERKMQVVDTVKKNKLNFQDWSTVSEICGEEVEEIKINNIKKLVALTKNFYIKIQSYETNLLSYKYITDLIGLATDIDIPKTIECGKLGNYHYVLTERIDGNTLSDEEFYEASGEICRKLKSIDHKISRLGMLSLDNKLIPYRDGYTMLDDTFTGLTYVNFLESRIRRLQLQDNDKVIELLSHIRENHNIKFSLEHGDLQPSNIMKSDNRVYVVDWEFCGIYPDYYIPLKMKKQYKLLNYNYNFDIISNQILDLEDIISTTKCN